MKLGSFGVVNAAVSASSDRGGVPTGLGMGAGMGTGGTSGGQVSAGFQRISRDLSFNVSGTFRHPPATATSPRCTVPRCRNRR